MAKRGRPTTNPKPYKVTSRVDKATYDKLCDYCSYNELTMSSAVSSILDKYVDTAFADNVIKAYHEPTSYEKVCAWLDKQPSWVRKVYNNNFATGKNAKKVRED